MIPRGEGDIIPTQKDVGAYMAALSGQNAQTGMGGGMNFSQPINAPVINNSTQNVIPQPRTAPWIPPLPFT